jgi:hypothetical protein
MRRYETTPFVHGPTGRGPHQEPNRLSLEKIVGRRIRTASEKGKSEKENYTKDDSLHKISASTSMGQSALLGIALDR